MAKSIGFTRPVQSKRKSKHKKAWTVMAIWNKLLALAKQAGRIAPKHKDLAKNATLNNPKDPDEAAFVLNHAIGALAVLMRERGALEQVVKTGIHLHNVVSPAARENHIVSGGGGIALVGKDAESLIRCVATKCRICEARVLFKSAIATLDDVNKNPISLEIAAAVADSHPEPNGQQG